jgi:Family of unknown function (DUF6931)
MFFSKPITPLPKVKAPTATELAAKFKPSPPAQALLKPDQTPAEYLHALEQNKHGPEAVHLLAHGMPERESTWWACQSSQKVASKLNPADHSALSAAQAWVKNPTPETKAAAAAAAAKTDYTGPGAWAAQAAAWSHTPVPAASAPVAPAGPAPPTGLAPSAAAGSVILAAGLVKGPPMPPVPKPKLQMPAVPTLSAPASAAAVPTVAAAPTAPQLPPVDRAKQSKMLQPFIDLGKEVATGKNTWA